MNETKKLIQQITEGIQDKKGKNIVIADLSKIGDTICNYLVICQGNSPSQVTAIVESVREFTRKGANSKPFAIDGLRNAEWVAMDYSDILVHVFLPETRDFYNLEHLWPAGPESGRTAGKWFPSARCLPEAAGSEGGF